MPLFDFSSYIGSLLSLPADKIAIQVLTGGCTNVTVRVTFTPPVHLSKFGQLQPVGSVVLKYAPPFLATDPTQALSVDRQVIEAEALVLLSGSVIPTIGATLAKFPAMRIPRLIHHDKERNVLWITDLGETLTLSDYLTSDPPAQDIERIATILGKFLAELFLATRNPSAETLSLMSISDSTADAYSLLVSAMRKALIGAGICDAELLVARAEYSLRNNDKVEPCLGMVDLWPGSILVDAYGRCGLVDWEYFGLSSASSELGMLVAHLHLMLLKTQTSMSALRNIQSFIVNLLQSYTDHASPPSSHFKHKALIAHGRELVIALDFLASDLDDASKERVLNAGIRSLRAAGDSENDLDLSVLEDMDGYYERLREGIAALLCQTQYVVIMSDGEQNLAVDPARCNSLFEFSP